MLVGTLTRHDDWVPTVAFSRNDKYVTSGSRDSEIRIWNVEQGRTTHNSHVLGEHDSEIDSVTFSSNDEHLILGSDDCKVVIWNVHSEWLANLSKYTNLHSFTCSFLCDGTHTALCSGNKLV